MAVVVGSDSDLILLYGLDENGATERRANSGSLGADYFLHPYTNNRTPGEVPSVDDNQGGRGADLAVVAPPYSSVNRYLEPDVAVQDTFANLVAAGVIPAFPDDVGDGITFGFRHKITDDGSYFTAQTHYLFGLSEAASATEFTSIYAGIFQVNGQGYGYDVALADYVWQFDPTTGWTVTAGAWPKADKYLIDEGEEDDDQWYTVIVSCQRTAVDNIRLYITWVKDGTSDYVQAYKDQTDTDSEWDDISNPASNVGWCFGANKATATSPQNVFADAVDAGWVLTRYLTAEDQYSTALSGISAPWTEPSYRVADHDVRVAYAHESSTMPPPRRLPVGGMNPRHVVNIQAERLRLYYEGFRPGRPWSRRRTDVVFDSIGPFTGKRNNIFTMGPSRGLVRQPGILPPEAAADCRNVEFSGPGVRRRRGFRIRRDIDSTFQNGINSMHSWRDNNDELFWLYKVGTSLWADDGEIANEISTGWPLASHVVTAVLDNRMVICSESKRAIWDGDKDEVQDFGEDAPSTGTRATNGTGLTGTYTWAYTFYDPVTGDETAPYIFTPITLANQGVRLSTMDTTPTNARFTQQKIYRTIAGGSAPELYYIGVQNLAATFDDNGITDGTTSIGEVNGSYITMTPPADFDGCVTHLGRMFYWSGNQLWWSEENEPLRWLAKSFVTTDFPIKCVLSQGYRLVVLTRSSTEIVESDFVRDDDGNYSIRRTLLSDTVGAPGPHCGIDWDDDLYWFDRRGIYRLIGDRIQKQSDPIDNLWRYLNATAARSVAGAYNHIRNQLWWVVPMAGIQDDNTRFNTVIVMHPGEEPRFTLHELEASFVTQWDDDLNGVRFGVMDHIGTFKEMESYEGDGAEGDESYTTEDDGDSSDTPSSGISSITGRVVTVHGTPGWTANALRGMGVILRDISTKVIYYYTIVENTTDTFTTNTEPSALLADGDGYYIGGMRAYEEPAEQDMKTPNLKHIAQMQTQFDNLTAGRFV